MLDIKNNLHKPIKDCEENSTNEMTYLEYIIYGYSVINCHLSDKRIEHLCYKATNEELNDVLDEIDWLIEK